ncbi:MAG: hypothetical protein K2O84_05900 [Oscillospiraceae bacterium]|nr:hypothetical protein [Oscillospiraceae bacterium]
MKTGTLATKLMLAAIFLTVLVYFAVNLIAYFSDPYSTAVAYAYTGEKAVTVSGYVVRDEEVLAGGGDLVYSSRGEGERVGRGGTVALIYPTVQALDDANTLRELSSQLEQLLYARSLSAGSQATARLDEEITAALSSFRGAMADGRLQDAGEQGEALRTAVLRRSYAFFGDMDLDASIASLQERISGLSAAAEADVTRVSAPKAGLFSGLVDGYEGILNLENIQEMTPETYRAITPPADISGVGKMVYGDSWAFVSLMRSEDVKEMQEGDTVTLRFQKGLDRDMRMKVSYISAEEGGRKVVVFSSGKYLHLATLLRHQNVQVIFESYDGVRVPRSALRVDGQAVSDENGQPVLDSQGNPKTQSVTCVYCLWGDTARQKPVQILWQEDDYILVAPDEEALSAFSSEQAREGRRLRPGDQVITAAADIYDGKVVR